MITRRPALALVFAMGALVVSSSDVHVQTGSPFSGLKVKHVGLVVRDINKAVTEYAGFLGVPVPKVGDVKNIRLAESFKGGPVGAKIAMFGMGDILLDLVEPYGGASPWRNHIERAGEGLQHMCIEVADVAPAVQELVKLGGTLESSSYVNMVETLGITFEVQKFGTMDGAGYVNLPTPTKFAAGPVDHVGIVVRDVEKAARLMGNILGVTPPPVVKRMGARMATFNTLPIAVEFIEPARGKNPWRDHLEQAGSPGIHHIGVKVKSLRENIQYAQKNGGQVVVKPTNGRAVVDIKSHPLPFAFELMER